MKRNIVFSSSLTSCIISCVLCTLAISCIKDADDDNQEPGNSIMPSSTDNTPLVERDVTFTANLDYIIGEWMAEYSGYDPMQKAVSTIRRSVAFNEDGTYDSHIQGVNGTQEGRMTYKEFEHEHGTYAFDETKQVMTYHVEYDMLLNFLNDEMERYPGKVGQDKELLQEYDETICFSYENEGRRDWIRIDDNLRSEEDNSGNLIYVMRHQ